MREIPESRNSHTAHGVDPETRIALGGVRPHTEENIGAATQTLHSSLPGGLIPMSWMEQNSLLLTIVRSSVSSRRCEKLATTLRALRHLLSVRGCLVRTARQPSISAALSATGNSCASLGHPSGHIPGSAAAARREAIAAHTDPGNPLCCLHFFQKRA